MRIAIVGGGPAGLITALYLCRLAGVQLTVYEKQPAPEYGATLCAEGLSREKTGKLEKDTGFSSTPFIAQTVQGLKVTFPNRQSALVYQPGQTLDRPAWQNGMITALRQNQVDLRFNCPITDPARLSADWVIGADGPTSRVRRAIGGRVTLKPAVQYRMYLDYPRDFLEFFFDEMFYTGKVNYGYGWVFPRKEVFNVGVAGTFALLDTFLEKYALAGEICEKKGAPIAINGTCFEQGRYYLIGDAAGLTNPLSCGGLAPIIACADFIRRAIVQKKPGLYTRLIRAHHYYPPVWAKRKRIFYQSGRRLRQVGRICGNRRVNPPAKAVLGRLARRPSLWWPVFRLARHIRTFKRVSW